MPPTLRCPTDARPLTRDVDGSLTCGDGHRFASGGGVIDLAPGAEAPGFGRLRAATYDWTFDLVNTRLLFGASPRHLAELHREAAEAARAGALLDVACGTGRWAIPELAGAQVATYVGVDAAMPMLRLAAAHLARRGHRDALLVHSGAEQLPLADAQVDSVVSSLGLQYVQDHAAALAELRRVLRPGGGLFCVAPALGLRARYDRRHRERERKDYPLDRERWPELLRAAGFGATSVQTVGALVITRARAA